MCLALLCIGKKPSCLKQSFRILSELQFYQYFVYFASLISNWPQKTLLSMFIFYPTAINQKLSLNKFFFPQA